MVIGELFDRLQAQSICEELKRQGIAVEMATVQIVASDQRTLENIYQLKVRDAEQAQVAHEYFRVRMGLPGAPPAPDPEWQKIRSLKLGYVTKIILGISIVIYLVKVLQPDTFISLSELFFFNRPQAPFMSSILAGQLWRLITPIFLHFNFLHILFNGMWIKDLGSVYESEKGSRSFFFFILFISILSNFLQYLAMGPRFGGLSGLVYGLLGYLWIYGNLHQEAKIKLPRRDIYLIVGWYFLCLTGMIGPIANVAHGVGLGMGMLVGLFPWSRKSHSFKKVSMYIGLALFFSLGTYGIELLKVIYF
jgi:GlpG protein